MSEVQFYQTVQAEELEESQIKAINIANLIRHFSATELQFLARELIFLNEHKAEILSSNIHNELIDRDISGVTE